ncbi:MAG: penicillin acylase family protein [Bdellovibrionaceae bacterium]|nr:penicillin acylase family protein [Bdellovibrionales bacterium]MCB9083630.1 penicillin acylase family protein [Pseudobdellovibrionaceae bacterium]
MGSRARHALLAVFFLVLTVGLGVVGQFGLGSLPPPMPKLYPFQGLWRQQAQKPAHLKVENEALYGAVEVSYDADGIPHLFAEKTADLYWAQGYITARDRLWQMDMQSRVAEGRLSELLGSRTQGFDDFFVRIGMRQAIDVAEREILKDESTRLAAERYADGVNAYIKTLTDKDLPIEYFLTRSRPQKWSVRQMASLLKLMSYRLAGYNSDLQMTHHLKKFGRARVEDLFPEFHSGEAPFVPRGLSTVNPTAAPKAPADFFISALEHLPPVLRPERSNGSNNWVVSGRKTRSGFSLLANDTHLAYSLPPIWYEVQLHSPDLNVYGATIPGAPGVILGFNDYVAWGVTNAAMDVMDWYEIEFRDEASTEYLVDGQWQKATITIEKIKIKGETPRSKRVLWTHVGPVVHREGRLALALRWAAHEPSNEFKALVGLNFSKSFRECVRSLEDYQIPAQNFICADPTNIGIWHNGKIPRRWAGQGRYVMDGRRSDHLWQGWLKRSEIPQSVNPPQGYLSSANQRPTDKAYPHYLGWDYPEPYRGKRIQEFLSRRERMDWTDMVDLQNDVLNIHARDILPEMMDAVRDRLGERPELKDVFDELNLWDYRDHEASVASSIFYYWWGRFEDLLWEDEFSLGKDRLYPSRTRTAQLIKNLSFSPDHRDRQWLDRPTTQAVEGLEDLLVEALEDGVARLKEEFGGNPKNWLWHRVRPTYIPHVSYIPGLGSEDLQMGGSQYSVNSNKGGHGPTWRMIVSFEPEPKGWGNFPGGISGNPFDPDYTRHVEAWSQGKVREFRRFKTRDQAINESQTRLSFYHPGKAP